MVLNRMGVTDWRIVNWLYALIGSVIGDGQWRVAGKRGQNESVPNSILEISVLVSVLPETHYK